MANSPDSVDYQGLGYLEMTRLWELPDDLLGGPLRMQEKAVQWVPVKEKEDPADWLRRVRAAVLFNGYRKALEDTVSKPFERPVSVQTEVDLGEFLEPIADDVDREGTNLTAFAEEVFREAVHRGLTHVLVDFPSLRPGATLDEARALRARPTFVHVQPPRLLGWRFVRAPGGERVLDMIRVYETEEVPDGPFGERTVERVRVYSRTSWEVHERIVGGSSATLPVAGPSGPPINLGPESTSEQFPPGGYDLVAQGPNPLGIVPLVTLYLNKRRPMVGAPVFEDVAWLNVAHYRSDSRQRAYLDFARIGTLALYGFSDADVKDGVTWGVNCYIRTEKGPSESKIESVVHGRDAVDAGAEDLKKLEEQMEALGRAPLVQRSSTVTATGEARDEARGTSQAQAWVRDLEKALIECYKLAAQWVGAALPEDFAVDVFSDFGITLRGATESELLYKLSESGKLTVETLLRELKRRGLFADDFDAAEEVERLTEEMLTAQAEADAAAQDPNQAPPNGEDPEDDPNAEKPPADDSEDDSEDPEG